MQKVFVCVEVLPMSTQWGHVEHSQFTGKKMQKVICDFWSKTKKKPLSLNTHAQNRVLFVLRFTTKLTH